MIILFTPSIFHCTELKLPDQPHAMQLSRSGSLKILTSLNIVSQWVLLVSADSFWPPVPSGVSADRADWVELLDKTGEGIPSLAFSPLPALDIICRIELSRRFIRLRISSASDLGFDFETFPSVFSA